MTSTIWKWQKTQHVQWHGDIKTHSAFGNNECLISESYRKKVEYILMSDRKYGPWSHIVIFFHQSFLCMHGENV